MSNQDVQGLLIQIEATTAQLRRELPLGEQSVSKFTKRVDQDLASVDSAFDRMGQQAQSSINLMRNAFGALAGAGAIGFAIQQADAFGQMADRIRMATKDAGEYDGVQQRLLATAGRTYRPLAEAQELYIRTADSLRSMGKETSAAMNVQDSFSYLLVTNSASQERATGAIDAYSKALQKGSIDADAWQTILAAMPTVVDVVAESTGKSAEEIRRLGAEGKLGLDMLTDALERSVEANGKLADSMGVAVRDALNNLNTAFAAYIGQANESHDVTGTLAAGIGVLSENIDLVANGIGVVVVAALAAYTRSALGGAAATAKATIAALEEANARRQQAAAAVQAAIADQRKAQTAVFLAQKEAIAAKGTAVQSQMSLQLAQARQAERAATDAVAAAQSRLRAASVGIMGMLGGPAGIAMLAAAAATAFLAFRDSSVEVEQKLEDLKRPLDEVISKFRTLNKDQQGAEIVKWAEKQRLAADQVQDRFDELAAAMRDAIVPPGRDPRRGELLQAYNEIIASMREAKATGQSLTPILEEAANRFKISPESFNSWKTQAGAVSDATGNLLLANEGMAALTAETDRNTASTNANNAAKAGMSAAGETYLQTLQKQLAGLQDNGNAVKAAERWVREHADATEADKLAVMSAAHAIESQKESNKAATAATKEATSETKKQAEQLQDFIAKSDLAVASALRQADAYWKGTDAVSELARQEKIEAEVLKLGEAAREKITASVNAEADARERMDLGQHYNQVLIETEAIEAQITATLQGADALEAYNVEKALAAQLASKNADALTEESEKLRKAMTDQRKAAQDLEKIGRSGSVMDRLYPESKLMKDFIKDQEALTEARRRAEKANDPAAVARYTKALEDLGIEYEGNKRDATAWGKLTNEAIDRVDEAFANAWKGIFDGADNLWDGLKEGFKQTLAELAHMAITKPIIISFANQVLRTNTKGGISDVWGALFGGGETIGNGGGGSGSGFGNIIDIGKNIYSIYDTLTGVGSEIASGFMKDGLTGAFKGGINYYSTMLEGVYSKVAAMFGKEVVTQAAANATSSALAQQAGVSAGNSLAVNAGQYAATSAASSTGQGALSSMLNSVYATLSNPVTWITSGMIASGKFYDAGYRLDTEDVAMKPISLVHFAMDPALAGSLNTGVKTTELATKLLEPIVGGKWANILSGGSLIAGFQDLLNSKIFGKNERFKTTVGSAVGSYSDGTYTGQGELVGWYDSARRFGTDVDTALHDLNETFSGALGGLLEMFDIEQTIETEASFRLRRTSGKLATVFAVTIDDAVMMMKGQYSKDGNVAKGLEKFFDDVMGRGLAQAIGVSDLPAYLKELTTGLKKAEEVSAVIGGLFQRFEGVNATLEAINLTAFGLTDAGLRAADSLLDLSSAIAGLENPTAVDKLASLGSLTSAYYENFFSEAERFDAALAAAKKQLEGVEIESPDSASAEAFKKALNDLDRSAFRTMVEDIDLTTDAGRQMFATMMQLAGQVDAYFDLVEQKAANTLASQMSAANGAFALVQRSISAEQQRLTAEYQEKVRQLEAQEQAQAQAAAQAAQAYAAARAASLQSSATVAGDRVKSLESLIDALDSALERLRDTSEETTKQLRAQAVATLEQALAGVRAGQSVLNFSGLEEALERASDLDGNTFASLEDFQREQGRTANMVAELRGVAGKQLTTEERLLKTLEDQLSVARSSASSTASYQSTARAALDREYELAMEALQKELDEAQRQMDALNGIDNSVMSVVDAVNAMSRAVTSALQFMGAGATPAAVGESTAAMVDRMYKAIAGYAPDSQGIAFWTEQLTSGKYSYAQFIKELEAARVPAFAAGGLHTGGLRLVGENGPELEVTGPSRIYSASQTAAMLSGGAAEEVRALRSDFAGMSDALRSIAKHTQQTARRVEFLERWDGDGMPGERTA